MLSSPGAGSLPCSAPLASIPRAAPRTAHVTDPSRDDLVRELERLSQGLLFISEADSPLSVVVWRRPGGSPSARRLAALTGEPHPDLVDEMTIDQFFRNAITPRPWHDGAEQTVVRRYASLVHFLRVRLAGVRVFRFGQVTIHTYVVGTSRTGDWIGLATTEIET